jgi:hypothetical protein
MERMGMMVLNSVKEKKDDESSDSMPRHVKEKRLKDDSPAQHNRSSNGQHVEKPFAAQLEEDGSASKYTSILSNLEFQTGNSDLNFSQEIHDVVNNTIELSH